MRTFKSYRLFAGLIFVVSSISLAGNAGAVNLNALDAASAHQEARDTLFSGKPYQVSLINRMEDPNSATSIYQVVATHGGSEDDYFIILCIDGEVTISNNHQRAIEIADAMDRGVWNGNGGDGGGGH